MATSSHNATFFGRPAWPAVLLLPLIFLVVFSLMPLAWRVQPILVGTFPDGANLYTCPGSDNCVSAEQIIKEVESLRSDSNLPWDAVTIDRLIDLVQMEGKRLDRLRRLLIQKFIIQFDLSAKTNSEILTMLNPQQTRPVVFLLLTVAFPLTLLVLAIHCSNKQIPTKLFSEVYPNDDKEAKRLRSDYKKMMLTYPAVFASMAVAMAIYQRFGIQLQEELINLKEISGLITLARANPVLFVFYVNLLVCVSCLTTMFYTVYNCWVKMP